MSEMTDSRVTLCPDGKYRWVFEVPMLKNPSILYDVYKVLGISFGVVWLLNVLLIGCEDGFSLENLWGSTYVLLAVALVLAVIALIAYVIVAWCYGWKYVVLFTMDEKEIVHQQMPRQVKKAQILGALTIRCIDILCRSRSRQTKCHRNGLSGCFPFHNHLRARQRRTSQTMSQDEPHQGKPAAEQESHLCPR